MEQFVSEKKIPIYQGLNVDILTIKENNRYYYDIYNMVNDEVYFIGRFEIDQFIYHIGYAINNGYLLIYYYEPIVGTNKSIVTKALKLYNLIDNISIIDSLNNIIDKFGSDYLVSCSQRLYSDKYNGTAFDKNLKNKSLKVTSRFEFNEYLISLKTKSLNFDYKNEQNNKIIHLLDYINQEHPKMKIKN